MFILLTFFFGGARIFRGIIFAKYAAIIVFNIMTLKYVEDHEFPATFFFKYGNRNDCLVKVMDLFYSPII